MKEVVTTREIFAAQGNIYMRLGDLRALVEQAGDMSAHATVHISEPNGDRVRGMRVVQRDKVEDIDGS